MTATTNFNSNGTLKIPLHVLNIVSVIGFSAFTLYCYLTALENGAGFVSPNFTEVALDLGLCYSHVYNCRRKLLEYDLIRVENRKIYLVGLHY